MLDMCAARTPALAFRQRAHHISDVKTRRLPVPPGGKEMSSMRLLSTRWARFALAAAGVVMLGVGVAEARGGKGFSFGSRGSKTFTAPPTTRTAPKATQPMQRSTTQPGATTQAGRGVAANATQSRFGGGFGGLLMGGLLGAGLFGLLSGSGLFGGMSGLAGFLGLLLQVALIGGLVWLAMAFFRSRRAAVAGPQAGNGGMERQSVAQQYRPASTAAGGFGAGSAAATTNVGPLELGAQDFEAFERLLGRVQNAYGREDVAEIRAIASSEMANYFAEDIAENQRNNVHNLVSDAKLLQGDLSEAWRESDAEYATVALRFSVLDTVVERGTGRVVSGSSEVPEEATELWTFVRRPGGNANAWKLSAIQQAE
jgi:predicted lipid-binding transport protein (Tim44 family)